MEFATTAASRGVIRDQSGLGAPDTFLVRAQGPVLFGSEKGTAIHGVLRQMAVRASHDSEEDDWDDASDQGDGANFPAPRTSRPARPALPPADSRKTPRPTRSGRSGSGDDRNHNPRIFIPYKHLVRIMELLQNPDQAESEEYAFLLNELMLYRSEQMDKIRSGSLTFLDAGREDAESKIFGFVRAFLREPHNVPESTRYKILEILLRSPENPASRQVLAAGSQSQKDVIDRTDPVWRRKVLAPLSEVILAKDVMRKAVMALKIPEVLDGQKAQHPGAIFNGVPGTGKTILLRAVAKVYENCGHLSFECNVAKMGGIHVNELGHNLDKFIAKALEEAREQGKLAFIFMDDATMAVKKAGNSSVKDYYEAALDVMKKYIGNYPELVFAISTNGDIEDFDDALVREMRLKTIHVPPPTVNEKIRLWKFYIGKNGILKDLTEEQYRQLATAMPEKAQGAAIETLGDQYLDQLKLTIHERALQGRESDDFIAELAEVPLPTRADVEKEITFGSFVKFVAEFDYSKSVKSGDKKKRTMGF